MKNKTKNIALVGILSTLAVIGLLITSYVPTGKLSIYAIVSFLTAIIIINAGLKYGFLFYIVVSTLAMILIPDKVAILPYVGIFGWYGIFKFIVEKLKRMSLEIIIKLTVMNIIVWAGYFLFQSMIPALDFTKFAVWAGIILLQPVFIIYDYVFTLVIDFYYRKFYNRH